MTKTLQLNYQDGKPFSSSSLKINSLNSSSAFSDWAYGMRNDGNLLGTIRSLDVLGSSDTVPISLNCTTIAMKNYTVHGESLHCEWGLISRKGWAIVNDSTNYVLNSDSWWDGPNKDEEDLYFFGHGLEYKKALGDFVSVAGVIAMPPRYIFGTMWTRWFNLDNNDVMKVVGDYISRQIPMDVFILDMDWHTKNEWGGYTFDKRLFPHPEATLSWLKNAGLHLAVNLHDDNGVGTYDIMHDKLAEYLGLPPSTGTIPFSAVNRSYIMGLEDIVLGHVEDLGEDFWWIDWQQGGTQGGCAGEKQNPTILLNMVRGTDHIRRNENVRGVVLARWGGLGNHRYQVGFSGDVADLTWQNLAYQPFFSLTSSNVGFGFWSHDLVGPADDLSMYTRWIQWGAYSGIFRSHDRGMSAGSCADSGDCAIVQVWHVPTLYFEANRQAMRHRVELTPYIYTAVRQAFDTGVSILRPMYYEFPELDMAYAANSTGAFPQYFFGDSMFISPVVNQENQTDQMAEKSIWIPPGSWIEKDSGTMYSGSSTGKIITKKFDIREVPVFVKAGAIIPTIPLGPDVLGVAKRQYNTIIFNLYPGSTSGSTKVYEDDGISVNYVHGDFAYISASYQFSGSTLTFTVSTQGSYTGQPKQRNYVLRIINQLPVTKATINGKSVAYERFGSADNSWNYDGMSTTLEIKTQAFDVSDQVEFVVEFMDNAVDLSGVKGKFVHCGWAKALFDISRVTPGANSVTGGNISVAASTGEELSYLAGVDLQQFSDVLSSFDSVFNYALQEVVQLKPKSTSNVVSPTHQSMSPAFTRWAHGLALMTSVS
eukprot:CAMPEP_0174251194 /NCGR_PEP_ID=MMETSP0439-20130205/1098_1 /TAXON_ID=0 /ORGANISM="Stereomyxa ramosa, Strain Chinc5" /LENGTH=818 /DNA_ID=CAMNT_0015331455 /DNA_START=326 /DNA_END=2782 /DNA_ORIENTATION=+